MNPYASTPFQPVSGKSWIYNRAGKSRIYNLEYFEPEFEELLAEMERQHEARRDEDAKQQEDFMRLLREASEGW